MHRKQPKKIGVSMFLTSHSYTRKVHLPNPVMDQLLLVLGAQHDLFSARLEVAVTPGRVHDISDSYLPRLRE